MKTIQILIASVLGSLAGLTIIQGQVKSYFSPDQIDIPYTKYVLDNGLRVIIHEDHKAPIVSINIWYHVGSKNEKSGRTGFAHLFEHLMFNGSENYRSDYFRALESIGATDLNGTTNTDRTNYFQNVPTAGLDQVLFLESDRMGHLLGAIDQGKLDEQRGVVQNEKRQYENMPYGREYEIITQSCYPKGHPYSWTVIGLMEDLDAASLEDVREWFKTYYGPSNAVLCIAGDVKPEDVMEKIRKYFGDIPPGPTLIRPALNIARRSETTRGVYEDRVPEARITMVWNVPQWGSKEAALLNLAADILSTGKTSRLYKKLVYEDQTASGTFASMDQMEIAGNFYVGANVKPGIEHEKVEMTINNVIQEFLENGPTQDEVDRVKAIYFSGFLKGTERIGGFGGKSDILASNEVFGGSPDYYKNTLKFVSEATSEDIKDACREWLDSGKYVLTCLPFPELKSSGSGVDRTRFPDLGTPVAAAFPDLQKATLKNGMTVLLAQRKGVPTIVGNLIINAGFASDVHFKPGTASLAMDLLDEGTTSMSALQISDKLQLLGATLGTIADLDISSVNFTTLKQTIEPTIELVADVVLNPAFLEKEFDRLKKEHLDVILQEKADPLSMALRTVTRYLFGPDHPYGNPMTGSGFQKTVETIKLEDVKRYYSTWFKPNNATLIVAGDISMQELIPVLENNLAGWKKGTISKTEIGQMKTTPVNKIYLIDRPGSIQSVIISGYLISPYGQVFQPALTALNNILGGDFVSRLNMNLREDKHWSYGAGSVVINTMGQRPFLTYVSVQADKTKETIQEIRNELETMISTRPVTDEEFERTSMNMLLQLPGMWETNSSVVSSLIEKVKAGLSDDYFKTYDAKVRSLTREQLVQLSKQVIKPGQTVYFVVGDKSKIAGGLKETGYDIIEIDPDGNPVK